MRPKERGVWRKIIRRQLRGRKKQPRKVVATIGKRRAEALRRDEGE